MKELSIEEKAKAYDEVFSAAKEWYNNPNSSNIGKSYLYAVFPELKEESDDERIRKDIVFYIAANHKDDGEKARWLYWLEKQGEQKPVDKIKAKFKVGDKIKLAREPKYPAREIIAIQDDAYYFDEVVYLPFSRQDEWELVEQNPADIVEPKFHEGDWVVYDHRPYQIAELPKEGYINLGLRGNGKIKFAPSTYCRHWTIQDAKDGDVLINDFHLIFIFKEIKNDIHISHCSIIDRGNDVIVNSMAEREVGDVNLVKCQPATKEQRDLLFSKIKEAGYEWDAEKKELKKIEQKPAWSEDDQSNFNELSSFIFETYRTEDASRLLIWFKSLKDRVQPKQEWSEEDEVKINRIVTCLENLNVADNDILLKDVDWLKSLRPQNTWKPSDEQMEALWEVYKGGEEQAALASLYSDLKKLKQ